LNDCVTEANGVRDTILLDKWSIVMKHRYRRGDVVVLAAPDNPHEKLVKRLIALEGDVIQDAARGTMRVIPQGNC
jgi:mitochondrial inner membrane protease subunit 2